MTDDYVPANLHYRIPNEDLHERIPIQLRHSHFGCMHTSALLSGREESALNGITISSSMVEILQNEALYRYTSTW